MEKKQESGHSGELLIKISGDTIEHLFVNAADAMADILSIKRYANVASTEHMRVESDTEDAGLVNFLDKVLAQSYAKQSVYVPESINVSDKKGIKVIEAVMRRYLVPAFEGKIVSVKKESVHIGRKGKVLQTKIVLESMA